MQAIDRTPFTAKHRAAWVESIFDSIGEEMRANKGLIVGFDCTLQLETIYVELHAVQPDGVRVCASNSLLYDVLAATEVPRHHSVLQAWVHGLGQSLRSSLMQDSKQALLPFYS